MLGRTAKALLLLTAAGTLSVTSLALPAVRAVVAVLPVSQGGAFSCSGLRDVIKRSHAEFGDIAAEVACAYLRKLSGPQRTSFSVRAETEQHQEKESSRSRRAESYLGTSER